MGLFSDAKVTLLNNGDLLAVADVTVGGAIRLRGIRIVRGADGPFVSFPAKKMPDGKRFEDIFYAVDPKARRELKAFIFSVYDPLVKGILEAKNEN